MDAVKSRVADVVKRDDSPPVAPGRPDKVRAKPHVNGLADEFRAIEAVGAVRVEQGIERNARVPFGLRGNGPGGRQGTSPANTVAVVNIARQRIFANVLAFAS